MNQDPRETLLKILGSVVVAQRMLHLGLWKENCHREQQQLKQRGGVAAVAEGHEASGPVAVVPVHLAPHTPEAPKHLLALFGK